MFIITIILGILIYLAIGVFVAVLNCDEYRFSYSEYGLTVVFWPINLVATLIIGIIILFDRLFGFIGRPVYKLSKRMREMRGK